MMDSSLADSLTAGEAAQTIVDEPVAVIVHAVADLWFRPLEGVTNQQDSVNTLLYLLVAWSQTAGDPAKPFVRLPIAIVVKAVAHFRLRG